MYSIAKPYLTTASVETEAVLLYEGLFNSYLQKKQENKNKISKGKRLKNGK